MSDEMARMPCGPGRKFTDAQRASILKGWNEAQCLGDDHLQRFPMPEYFESPLLGEGDVRRPVLDVEGTRAPMVWPGGRSFAVCLTHDVDVVNRFSVREQLRRWRRTLDPQAQFNGEHRFGCWPRITARILQSMVHSGADPYNNFELWRNLEQAVGAPSTFFFFPEHVGLEHNTDCLYKYSDRLKYRGKMITVAELVQTLDAEGCEIGLHPSWRSSNSHDEMKRQKEVLERILDKDVVSVRQHFLHYDIRETPRVHADVGFRFDSSIGFNRRVGFRFGTSHPWEMWDLNGDCSLGVVEIPLIIQDVALFGTGAMGLDMAQAIAQIQQIVEEVKNVGGVLTVLWHTNAPSVGGHRLECFEALLDMCQARNAWFATMRDVGDYWLAWREI